MNLARIALRILLLAFSIALGFGLQGCESDPILAPQAEVAEEGGSYGNTNLPVSGTTTTQDTIEDTQNTTTNPKRF